MAERYRHTQVARPSRVIFGILAAMLLGLAITTPAAALVSLPVLALLAFIGLTFTSITTVVTDRTFVHHFGLGFWRKTHALDDIVSAEPVRNRWWYGWGMRLTPRGWLYNTWGLDAVEIRLAEGRTFRVGTDEPRALADAIRGS